MIIVGKVVEVGKMECCQVGSNGNEVVIEIVKGQTVRVQGISDTVLRYLASNLFNEVELAFSMVGSTADGEVDGGK